MQSWWRQWVTGSWDPASVKPGSGRRGSLDKLDQKKLAAYINLVWFLKGTDEARPLRAMMVRLTKELFPLVISCIPFQVILLDWTYIGFPFPMAARVPLRFLIIPSSIRPSILEPMTHPAHLLKILLPNRPKPALLGDLVLHGKAEYIDRVRY
jgi:hypothetical protein